MSILENQIKEYYIKKENISRIEQGDLLTDVPISQILSEDENGVKTIDIIFHHMLVVSQDCDLEQFFTAQKKDEGNINPYLHNVILIPCFFKDEMETGGCLDYIGISQSPLNKKQFDKIKKSELVRYQYLEQDYNLSIPELYLDFKAYYTLPPNYLFSLYDVKYVATINALFRERITQRYTNYISRIGLPVLH